MVPAPVPCIGPVGTIHYTTQEKGLSTVVWNLFKAVRECAYLNWMFLKMSLKYVQKMDVLKYELNVDFGR